jgi:hypothetical protein
MPRKIFGFDCRWITISQIYPAAFLGADAGSQSDARSAFLDSAFERPDASDVRRMGQHPPWHILKRVPLV